MTPAWIVAMTPPTWIVLVIALIALGFSLAAFSISLVVLTGRVG